MRPKTYSYRKANGSVMLLGVPFTAEHYAEMGVPYTPEAGMPQLEALTLVNKWNRQWDNEGYVYWLGGMEL